MNGFIVMDQGGAPLYSNVHYTKLAVDPALIAGFLSAIQSFSKQITSDAGSGINEMTLHNIKILYRGMETYTFIGLVDSNDKIKDIEPIMENMICAFLAKFRKQLREAAIQNTSLFSSFDLFFEKWRAAKEKELQKWCEKASPTLLQGALNKLVNFFPAPDLVKINPLVLKGIGRKLIWVSTKITDEEESRIYSELKNRTDSMYGPGMFENLEKDVKNDIETQKLIH